MRATPKKIFLLADRIPEVHFYTSNVTKFLQARLLFDRVGLRLRHFKALTEPYAESYERGKDELLRRAVEEVSEKIGGDFVFFVEDTSLRLDALSTVEMDVPGLAVKEWFEQTDFQTLDNLLLKNGNNRRATVKSDIALHVPGLDGPLFFRGETAGVVAASPATQQEPPPYPWLGANTFNGWFVPDGAPSRLAELDVEQSLEFDFRAKAVMALLDRLEEYAAFLNLPNSGYRKRQSIGESSQRALFDTPPLIVIGATCAGKTTFALRAGIKHHRGHVEASSIVRMHAGAGSSSAASALEAAKEVLERGGADVVARQIVKLYANDLDAGLVLTGFRTIEELLHLCEEVPEAQVIFIEAALRTRFARHLDRGRYKEAESIEQFAELDRGQESFGLLKVGRDLADLLLENEDSLDDYHERIDLVVTGAQDLPRQVRRLPDFTTRQQKSQLFRCLRVLAGEKLSATSREIAAGTMEKGTRRVVTRNVNETLKHYPELADRQESPGQEIRYRITPAGRAYVEFMKLRAEARRARTKEREVTQGFKTPAVPVPSKSSS